MITLKPGNLYRLTRTRTYVYQGTFPGENNEAALYSEPGDCILLLHVEPLNSTTTRLTFLYKDQVYYYYFIAHLDPWIEELV